MKIITLTKGCICLVDDFDYESLSLRSWSLHDTGGGPLYALSWMNGKTVFMHRLIMNSPKGVLVDHVNGTHVGNVLDNQRQNLRHASCRLNQRNRSYTVKQTSSGGLIGVCLDRRMGKWFARAKVNGKQLTIGSFGDKYEAFEALEKWKTKTGFRDRETLDLKGEGVKA